MIAVVFEMSYPMQTIAIALVVSVIAPLIVAFFNNNARRNETKLNWAREDKKEAEKEKKADEVARRLMESNAEVAKTSGILNNKVDVIHTLVNSNMTAAMRNELEATIRELALMKQIVERDRVDGRAILPESISAIDSTTDKIRELSSNLNSRLEQTALADKQVAERLLQEKGQ